jgi:hypothetical protein
MERRKNYRVNDVLPMIVRKVAKHDSNLRSKIILGYEGIALAEVPLECDNRFDARLWQFLIDINNKLDVILDRLSIDSEGLVNATNRHATISTGDMSFTLEEAFELEDWIEIKILLPIKPCMGIVVYGEVVRIAEPSPEGNEIAVKFFELEPGVENVLSQYVLQRQREMLRKRLEV